LRDEAIQLALPLTGDSLDCLDCEFLGWRDHWVKKKPDKQGFNGVWSRKSGSNWRPVPWSSCGHNHHYTATL